MTQMRAPRSAFLLLLAFLLGGHGVLAGDIGLTPPRLEIVVPAGGSVTESVSLATTSADAQQVRVSLSDWTLAPTGEVVYFAEGSLPTSAAAWIEPETSDVLVAPGAEQAFRLTVSVPDDATLNGTYQAMVMFQVVPRSLPDDGIATTTRIALTVYVTVAGTERDAVDVVDFYDEDGALTLAIANDGNTVQRLGGHVEIRDDTGAAVASVAVPDVPVLRDSERWLRLALPSALPDGFYVALALVEPSRGGLLAGELPLTLP